MAKDVIEKILDREKAADAALADAQIQAEKILTDAGAQAEKIIADAKREATEAVNKKILDSDSSSADLTKQYSERADAEIEKITANAAAKEDEALKALTDIILK